MIDNVLVLEAGGGDIWIALKADAPALARVINDAFIVEAFFMIGERCRTSVDEIVELMEAGEFLVTGDTAGAMTGCVYLTCAGERAYFGMLSIDPPRQKRGLGRRLIDAVETRARERGCRFMDIHIVNLREDLAGYYGRLGYAAQGTLPFSHPHRPGRPCHFIVMTKTLTPFAAGAHPEISG